MTVQEQLRALVERHLSHLGEDLATIGALLTPKGDTLPVAQVSEAEAITHQLKGTSGSMGLPDISGAASALDETLKLLCKAPAPIPAVELQAAQEQLATLRRIAEGTTPAMSTLYNADVSKLGSAPA
jgi:HPt (histidine-containing phosphotransfer) domain-containing protein